MVRIPFSTIRNDAMEAVFSELNKIVSPLIIEVGRTRDAFGMDSDGYSTIHFAQYIASHSGLFISIDSDRTTEELCRFILKRAGVSNIDGFLKFINVEPNKFYIPEIKKESISLLFLDGPDCDLGREEASAQWHLKCFKFLENSVAKEGMVLIDDCFDPLRATGKGKDVVPYLLEKGYDVLFRGYMWLLRKPFSTVNNC